MPVLTQEQIEAMLTAWLAPYKAATQKAYRAAWRLFVQRCGNDPDNTVTILCGEPPEKITARLDDWATDLAKTAPSTITVRFAAINSLIGFLRGNGEGVPMPKRRAPPKKRDMRGPDTEAIAELHDLLQEIRHTPLGARDLAIFSLMFLHGLRREEVVFTDVGHVDHDRKALWIIGKGRRDREPIELHPSTVEALAAWLEHHDDPRQDAPLFYGLTDKGTRSRKGRLTADSVHKRFKTYYAPLVALRLREATGRTAPVVFRPNGFRHTAITLVALGGGNIRKFARHQSLASTQFYLDLPEVTPDELRECANAIADAFMNRKASNNSSNGPEKPEPTSAPE